MTVLTLDYIANLMQHSSNPAEGGRTGHLIRDLTMSIGDNNNAASNKTTDKRPGKRPGRKPSKIDERAKLERSRQSARECRARKKLRYQYLEELVVNREKAVFALRNELETYKQWCIQLESGGKIPDAILKMIANEDMSAQRRQIEQGTRSMLQQQKQQQQFQFSSSSSSTSSTSSETSPPSFLENQQHQHNRQVSVVQPQSKFPQSSPPAQLQDNTLATPSSNIQHLLQHHQATSTTPLKRPTAFDYTQSKASEIQTQQLTNVSDASSHRPGTYNIPQHLLPKDVQYHASVKNKLVSQQQRSIPESVYLYGASSSRTSQEHFMSQVKSEPPFKYDQQFRTFSNTTSSNSQLSPSVNELRESETIRRRSLSNPTSMTNFARPSLPSITSAKDMPSPLQDFITSHSSSSSIAREPSSICFGMFTGNLIGKGTLSSSLNNLNPITVEDSSSSDENVNEKQLFQSSSLSSQKRTSSVPIVPENPKRQLMNTSTLSQTSTNYDPQTRLQSLTNVNCLDMTKTFNTLSPSSNGLPSSCVPSPTPSLRYSGMSSSTPSSTTTSPAPLLSLSSLLDFSEASPASYLQDTILEMANHLSGQPTLSSNSSAECPPTSLDSIIAYQTPEWYSFLDDLQENVALTFTSRHGASSGHGTPRALTPRQQEQPLTPDSSFMNVPNIIDEILDSEDQML